MFNSDKKNNPAVISKGGKMPKDVLSTLTPEVVGEICSRYRRTFSQETTQEVKKLLTGVIIPVEDNGVFLKKIREYDPSLVIPFGVLLRAYFFVKKTGIKIAEKTGFFICLSCEERTFRKVGQAIAPCVCEGQGGWKFYWDSPPANPTKEELNSFRRDGEL